VELKSKIVRGDGPKRRNTPIFHARRSAEIVLAKTVNLSVLLVGNEIRVIGSCHSAPGAV
jgi:hypothetical protein